MTFIDRFLNTNMRLFAKIRYKIGSVLLGSQLYIDRKSTVNNSRQ